MEAQYATVWERNSDVIPDKIALICGDKQVTWKDYDDRAARLAQVLTEAGLGDDSKVGLYLHNSNEYLEAQYSVFKIRGVPITVNYRYKEEELIYLLDNSDSEAVFYQGCYTEQIEAIKDKLPNVKLFIQVDDGKTCVGKTNAAIIHGFDTEAVGAPVILNGRHVDQGLRVNSAVDIRMNKSSNSTHKIESFLNEIFQN